MSFPTAWQVIQCVLRRLKYLNRRDAYFEATAKNLEIAAGAVAEASEHVIRNSRRQELRTAIQRKRIARANDTLTKLLERTKTLNDNSTNDP